VRATGNVVVDYRSAGRTTRFTQRIANGIVRVAKALPAAQRRKQTGIVTMSYAGSTRVRRDAARVRAAPRRARLTRRTTSVDSTGRLHVSGATDRRAHGFVRIRFEYTGADGRLRALWSKARIFDGRWSLTTTLPSDASTSGGELSIQYSGDEKHEICGQQLAVALSPASAK
jgi:hypothetical protein